jgi:imidazolonepropionase-like amidohydrolase
MSNQKKTATVLLVACLVFVATMVSAHSERQKSDIKTTRTVAFVEVNVVPMDRERIIEKQTVIVQDGSITEIGPASKLQVPPDALQIDGHGRYLMPGLADMHVHLSHENEDELVLFLANGVTTVRNMYGIPIHLEWRKRICDGDLLGPTIYTTGPIIDGNPPLKKYYTVIETPEEAEKEVAAQKQAGYDAIKVLSNLSPDVYEAILVAAKEHNFPVYGHVPKRVGLEKAMDSGQLSFEHMNHFLDALWPNDSPDKPADLEKIPDLAARAAAKGVWVCPTLEFFRIYAANSEEIKAIRNHPSMKYVPAQRRDAWNELERYLLSDQWDNKGRVRVFDIMFRMVKGLHEAGAKLIVGTDCPIPFEVPGFSLHGELQNFVDAGITPYAAIKAATRDAAEFVGALDKFGTVTVGRRADLILVKASPLDDVANVAKRVGVMVRGRWFSESELQEKLDLLAEKFAKKDTNDN